jgi:hypothetical protein
MKTSTKEVKICEAVSSFLAISFTSMPHSVKLLQHKCNYVVVPEYLTRNYGLGARDI